MEIELPPRIKTQGMTDQAIRAAAWDQIWNWAEKNGLPEYSFLRREKYAGLNGPEMLAQWIIDLAEGDSPPDSDGRIAKAHRQWMRGIISEEERDRRIEAEIQQVLRG